MDEYDLEEIKREIVESRSLTIKTNNLVNALAADLKSLGKRQQAAERRMAMNSATAYAVTIAVILLLVKVAWDYRVQSMRAESKSGTADVKKLETEIAELKAAAEAEVRARRTAADLYALVRSGKRRQLLDEWAKASSMPLTRAERAMLEDAVRRARTELSVESYQAGLEHARAARWHEAQTAFNETLELEPEASHAPRAKFELARALRALERAQEAVPILLSLSESSTDKELQDDAMFLLAKTQVELQDWNAAKSTLRRFTTRFKQSPLLNDAVILLAEIQLKH